LKNTAICDIIKKIDALKNVDAAKEKQRAAKRGIEKNG